MVDWLWDQFAKNLDKLLLHVFLHPLFQVIIKPFVDLILDRLSLLWITLQLLAQFIIQPIIQVVLERITLSPSRR